MFKCPQCGQDQTFLVEESVVQVVHITCLGPEEFQVDQVVKTLALE